jgi:aryl-alcohol dehydrogenase-like predicted oxidoreductase
MRYKFLGRSGLKVSEICLGTMSFGDAWGFGADAAESGRILAAYAEAGGNFIDTANKYHEGHTEEILGGLITPADRDRWVLATKYTLAMGSGDPNAAGNSRKNMRRAVEGSLRRLKTDHIDLLWLHAWDYATPVEEVMRALDDLVAAGKVLYVGVSDTPAWIVAQANTLAELRGWSPFVALQIEYSLLERTVERELLPMAAAFGLTVTPWAALGGGVLTGKYTRHAEPTDTKRAAGNERRTSAANLAIAREVDAVADALGRTSAQVALNWVRQRGDQVLPIVGARKVSQIQDLLGCLDFALDATAMAHLDEASRIELGFPHDFLTQPNILGIVYGDQHQRIDRPGAKRRA